MSVFRNQNKQSRSFGTNKLQQKYIIKQVCLRNSRLKGVWSELSYH